MISRSRRLDSILDLLKENPALTLLGLRQKGKTTLALERAIARPSIYPDLESPADLNKFAVPEAARRAGLFSRPGISPR